MVKYGINLSTFLALKMHIFSNKKCKNIFVNFPLFCILTRICMRVTRNSSEIRFSIKYRVISKVNYGSKYQTENYGLGHFGKIKFQRILLLKMLLKCLRFIM